MSNLKRTLSPASLPLAKRAQPERRRETAVDELYDELILYVFSHLSWVDLCIAQATSRRWARLATDNQLWKSLYLQEYGRARLRGARGFIGRTDGRPVKPLPGRVRTDLRIDWKSMFRISSNWRRGRCAVESLDSKEEQTDQTHILLAGNLTISASSRPSHTPTIQLHSLDGAVHSLCCGQSRNSELIQITALALDQSPPVHRHCFRLSSFCSTGRITIFNVNHNAPSRSVQKLSHTPVVQNSRTSPIIQAVYHHPLLITLSEAFHLSVYDISSGIISHRQTLSSFTSFPPSSLVLSTPSLTTYKLVLVYAVPVYPAHWSVGATELIISANESTCITEHAGAERDSNARPHTLGLDTSMAVVRTRTTRTYDTPNGWITEQKLRLMREQWGRKVFGIIDTQTDGKWVVLAPATVSFPASSSLLSPPPSSSSSSSSSLSRSTSPSESSFMSPDMYSPNILQLYRLSMSATNVESAPKLVFVRNLFGPIGAVSSLSLADGRCVGLAANGSVWMWDLESGDSVEVAAARSVRVGKGSVAFDERRIVSADVEGLVVRRFDIY